MLTEAGRLHFERGIDETTRAPVLDNARELLSIERLDERAKALAASFTVDPDSRRRRFGTWRSQGRLGLDSIRAPRLTCDWY